MSTNNIIINFIINNIYLIALFLLFTIRIVPPNWAGFWKYNNNKEKDGNAPKITLLRFILTNLIDSILSSFIIPFLAAFEFKKMVTLIIFIVVIFDIFFRHQISTAAVTLVAIGIITLYLEKLIESGKIIKLFGGLITWEKDK